ncbi:dephospho-CoA kinase [Variovorax sp. PAMC 28711]|uniref:dephospho-CoA kinase n=1 Tax=Variovorax sp. PAMC 28711 TaxID=1795631 RepID=UPI001EEE1561|nr:dephospho-CoA kinase [Variovorax sp. PAMC 28711]
MFVALGATLVDTDAIARALTQPAGAAMQPIEQQFGAKVLDINAGLDRARMRELVFADPTLKAKLEAILHPLIGEECTRQEAAAVAGLVVFDVPLLVESTRWRRRVDRVLVIDAPEEKQVERVMARSNWTRKTVLAVMANQTSRQRRLRAADGVIFNGGKTLEELGLEVHSLWDQWVQSPTR